MDNYKVLRASRIGHPCNRNLFYFVNGSEETTNEKSSRIFDIGKALEPVIISWLRSDGWNVKRNPIDGTNNSLSLGIEVNGGVISAHPDCVISHHELDGNILVDIKTMNDRAFRTLKRDGTKKSHPQYFAQVHLYAEALRRIQVSVSKLGIVAMNKNTSELFIDTFDFEQDTLNTLLARAERIFSFSDAPEQGELFENWCCQYCGYSHLCELAKKDTAVGTEDVPTTDKQEVIDAVELLSESRDMEKAAKELSDEAKVVIDREIRQQGIKSVRVGHLVLVLNEIKSSRLDTTALKKAHPEIVQEFMKQSSSVRYDLKEVA